MRAPMIPGKKPEDDNQREAMLRRLGINEDRPRVASRWDVLARDLEPAAPIQTPPPVNEAPAAESLPAHQPIPMAEALHTAEPEAMVEAPVALAPKPESTSGANFMPGWGEESIPEERAEASVEPAAPVEAVVHQPRWMDEPVAEAPRRDELLPPMERAVSYTPSGEGIANDDLAVPEPPKAEAEAPAPVMEASAEPFAPRAPQGIKPRFEFPVAREPVARPPEPVVDAPVAPEPVVEVALEPTAPDPEPEPVIEPPVTLQPAPEPIPPEPQAEPEPAVQARRAPEPEAASASPPVDAALQQMRAELEAMRKQFQAPPEPAMPLAAAIPYEGRRRKTKTDFFANARMVVWTLGIVVSLWVSFHALQASSHHPTKQDHILASVTGKENADDTAKNDQNSDN